MAIGVKAGRMMFQRGTKAQWEASNLVLLDGELAIEADTTKIKIGDGKHKYIDLPYIEIGEIRVADLSEEDIKKITGRKGEKGDPLRFEDLNPEQKKELKGEPFRYEDFTPDQLAKLKGEPGKFDINSLSEEEKKIFKTELVNDLTTGGVDKALSAEQGKVLFQSVDKGKDLIAKALVDKNVQASKDESFGDLANKIKDIRASGGGYGVGDIIEPEKIEPMTREHYRYKVKIGIESYDGCIYFNRYGNAYINDSLGIVKYSKSGNEAICEYYDVGNISSWRIRFGSDDSVYITTNSLTCKYDYRGVKVWDYGVSQLHELLKIDYKGNAYIQDSDNTITKISINGEILWKLKGYEKCSVDSLGNIYAIHNNTLKKFDTDSKLIWDNKLEGCKSLIAIDSDNNIYVNKDGKITKINGDGNVIWESEVYNSAIIAYTGHDGYLYFLRRVRGRVKSLIKYSKDGAKLWEIAGQCRVDKDSCVYATNNNVLEKYSKDGAKLWEIAGVESWKLGHDDCLYTWSDKTVRKRDKEGKEIASLGDVEDFINVTVDEFGNIYKYNKNKKLFSRYEMINKKDVTGYKIIS